MLDTFWHYCCYLTLCVSPFVLPPVGCQWGNSNASWIRRVRVIDSWMATVRHCAHAASACLYPPPQCLADSTVGSSGVFSEVSPLLLFTDFLYSSVRGVPDTVCVTQRNAFGRHLYSISGLLYSTAGPCEQICPAAVNCRRFPWCSSRFLRYHVTSLIR